VRKIAVAAGRVIVDARIRGVAMGSMSFR